MPITLRQTAEERIKKGTAPVTGGLPVGAQALTLLHCLASAPETAGDALKLLHELQVHQVELDLQREQAEQERHQLDDDLSKFSALFDLAPFAYLTMDPDGLLLAANRIAADTFTPHTCMSKPLFTAGAIQTLAQTVRTSSTSAKSFRRLSSSLRFRTTPMTCSVNALQMKTR